MTALRAWRSGRRVVLAQEIARGGEGIIYQLEDNAEILAKVFIMPPSREKLAKVSAMVSNASPELQEIAAWPQDMLLDSANHAVGFTMRKIAASSGVHELYSPRSRAMVFPEADLRFLVHAAANIVRAFGQMHTAGHIIGDVNHNNLLASRDGRVSLIDCDSFQIKSGNVTYTCDVGVPLFTAPELQGRPFRGLVRTQQHDLFGLAVLIFHLLFMGRHPFAGIWQGSQYQGIEDHIKARRFAYGAQRSKMGIERPPNTVALETFGPDIAALFEQAFTAAAGYPQRPASAAWLGALQHLADHLVSCAETASHYFHDSQASCPWCPLEKATNARLFGRRFAALGEELLDIAGLWRSIDAVTPMAPAPALPSDNLPARAPKPWLERLQLPRSRRYTAPMLAALGLTLTASTGSMSVFVIFAGLAAWVWPWVTPATRAAASKQLAETQAHYDSLTQRWHAQASSQLFNDTKESLVKLRYGLDELERERRYKFAEAATEAAQRQQYLSRFLLAHADISFLDADHKQTLIGVYGIETAADIHPDTMAQVRSFGLALTDALSQWRAAHEKEFVFDPTGDVDTDSKARIEQDLAERRHHMLETVRGGPARLEQARKSIDEARKRLREPLQQAWAALCVAREQWEKL